MLHLKPSTLAKLCSGRPRKNEYNKTTEQIKTTCVHSCDTLQDQAHVYLLIFVFSDKIYATE